MIQLVRKPRQKSRNGFYHIMMRGINKQIIFEDDMDRLMLLSLIKKYRRICGFNLYGYCFMNNHIHLLLQEKEETVSKVIQRISVSYVQWYNKKYDRCGHLFQDRFRSEVVETSSSFLKVLRYIHQNPLKAGLTKTIFEWEWSSIHDYLRPSDFIDREFVLQLFSTDSYQALQLFSNYMQLSNNDEFLDDIPRITISDAEIIDYLKRIDIPTSSALQQLQKEKRNAIIADLKMIKGISIRQLARITGISKSVIDRIQ
ncbi:transposase [Heyndrickxia oleronia]|uniref:transposase n=1 Tax=Heyndrickxia oleronia TaxID=38875 RepID=UPI003F278759